jgi:peptidyl-prolyl cis-trans isomerase SurA
MKKVLLLLSIIIANMAIAQSTDPVIMTVNNKFVYKSEFERIFWKNKKETTTDKKELDEYLELFIKFKLKVEAAKEMRLDTIKKFRDEFSGYQVTLQRPYLVDTMVNEALIQEAYYRTVNELRASHILILVAQDAPAVDTLAAFKKINTILEDINKGKISFDDAAIRFSEDKSAATNKGDLGYFSAFRMVYPFEDAAYKTPIGSVSKPFKTQFGYHIVKPVDMRKTRGRVKVAHVMVRLGADASEQDKLNAKKKIDEIYEKASKGEDFSILVRDFSDDRNSVRKNGELEWVEAGKYYAEFEEASFQLAKDGDISTPVLTPAGWHIIKRLKYQPIEDLESLRNELKNKIQRDSRSQKTRNSFVNKLKVEYKYTLNKQSYDAFVATVDNSLTENKWTKDNLATLRLNAVLFTFAGKEYTQQDFARYIQESQNFTKGTTIAEYLNTALDRYVSGELIEYEKTRLESKYPAYSDLLNEYREGILLYEINDMKVWSYALKDSVGMRNFYDAKKQDYKWEDRVDARIFIATDKKVIDQAFKLIKKGKLRNDSIVNLLNANSQLNIKFESGRYEVSKNEYTKNIKWVAGLNKPILYDGRYVIIAIDKVIPSEPKKLEEAKGFYIAAYQDYLEKVWIEELRVKYPVQVNKEVLYSIKNK